MVTFRSFLKLIDKIAPPGIDMYVTVSGIHPNALHIVRGARYIEFGPIRTKGSRNLFIPLVKFEHNTDTGPVIVTHTTAIGVQGVSESFALDEPFCWGNETNPVEWWRAVELQASTYGWFQDLLERYRHYYDIDTN